MAILDVVILLVVAVICAAVGQAIVGYTRGGCLVSVVLGFIGSLLGAWLARVAGLPEIYQITIRDQPFPLVWAIIGGILFVSLIAFIFSRLR